MIRVKVRVELNGPCICIYVLSIIWNSMIYIGFTYMYVSHIIFCIILNTWLHTKILYEGLDNVFALQNLQTPSFKLSQIVFAPLQNLFWCIFNVNFCHQQLYKSTPLTYDLGLKWNFGETWKIMSNTIFSIFQLIWLHKLRDLTTSLKSPQIGTLTHNNL
jgi:hypothetical protein